MYSISNFQKPPKIAMSRCPMVFSFRITPWSINESDTNTRLRLAVSFGPNSSTPVQIKSMELTPDENGICHCDLAPLLDAQMTFNMPAITSVTSPEDTIEVMTGQYGRYSLALSLYNDYEQLKIGTQYIQYLSGFNIIKAGLNRANQNVPYFLNTNILQQHKFLRFPTPAEKYNARDSHWLTALVLDDLASTSSLDISTQGAQIIIERTNYYLDDTSNTVTTTTDTYLRYGTVFSVPARPVNDNLSNLHRWRVTVKLQFDSVTWTVGEQVFYADYHLQPDAYVYYHNSLGGVNLLRLLSIDGLSYNYERVFSNLIKEDLFLSKSTLAPDMSALGVKERERPVFLTPLLSQPELQALRDMFLSSNVWTLKGNKLVPCTVSDESLKIGNTDGMYALGFNLDGGTGEINYTPDNYVDDHTVCSPPLELFVKQVQGDIVDIYYKFPPGVFAGQVELWGLLSGTMDVGPVEVTGNTGYIRIQHPNITNEGAFRRFYVKLRSKCSYNSFSSYIQTVDPFYLYILMAPFLPNLYATTFKGGEERTLVYQTNLDNLLYTAQSLNPGVWKTKSKMVAGDASVILATGSAGGTFKRYGPNIDRDVILKYTPPSPAWTGIDKLTYWAYDYNDTDITDHSEGVVYVTVSQGIVAGSSDGSGVVPGSAIYIKMVVSNVNELVEYQDSFDPNEIRIYKSRYKLYFYSDPYGLQPLNVTGMGISVTMERTLVSGGSGGGGAQVFSPVYGSEYDCGYLMTRYVDSGHFSGGTLIGQADFSYEWDIQDSDQYFILQ